MKIKKSIIAIAALALFLQADANALKVRPKKSQNQPTAGAGAGHVPAPRQGIRPQAAQPAAAQPQALRPHTALQPQARQDFSQGANRRHQSSVTSPGVNFSRREQSVDHGRPSAPAAASASASSGSSSERAIVELQRLIDKARRPLPADLSPEQLAQEFASGQAAWNRGQRANLAAVSIDDQIGMMRRDAQTKVDRLLAQVGRSNPRYNDLARDAQSAMELVLTRIELTIRQAAQQAQRMHPTQVSHHRIPAPQAAAQAMLQRYSTPQRVRSQTPQASGQHIRSFGNSSSVVATNPTEQQLNALITQFERKISLEQLRRDAREARTAHEFTTEFDQESRQGNQQAQRLLAQLGTEHPRYQALRQHIAELNRQADAHKNMIAREIAASRPQRSRTPMGTRQPASSYARLEMELQDDFNTLACRHEERTDALRAQADRLERQIDAFGQREIAAHFNEIFEKIRSKGFDIEAWMFCMNPNQDTLERLQISLTRGPHETAVDVLRRWNPARTIREHREFLATAERDLHTLFRRISPADQGTFITRRNDIIQRIVELEAKLRNADINLASLEQSLQPSHRPQPTAAAQAMPSPPQRVVPMPHAEPHRVAPASDEAPGAACVICLDGFDQASKKRQVLVPCGHAITCAECAPQVQDCPACRTRIKHRINAYADDCVMCNRPFNKTDHKPVILQPCGHTTCEHKVNDTTQQCPLCLDSITDKQKVFF